MTKNRKLQYKQTPIGLIPEDWEVKKLGELCKIKKGEQLNKIGLNNTDQYPVINGGVTPSGYTEKWNTLENTITISEGGNSCGFINLITSKFWSGGHCYTLLQIKEGVEKKYLFFYLKNNERKIMKLRVGSGLPNIQLPTIFNLLIILPHIPEQQKIATILSTWDTAIDNCKAIIKKLKERNKGLARVLLSESRMTQLNRLHGKNTKNNQSVSSMRYDKSMIQTNKKWKSVKLGELCKIKKGEQLNKIGLNNTDQYPVINGGVTPSGYTEKWNTLENTITISEGGNSCGFINLITSKFWSGGHCYTLLQLKEGVENKYLFFYLKNNEEKIMKLKVGSGLPNIQLPAIFNLLIMLPPIHEQQQIVAILDTAVAELNNYEQKLLILQQQKKGLMQQLLTGKRRIKTII